MLDHNQLYYPTLNLVLDSKLDNTTHFSSDDVAEIIALINRSGFNGNILHYCHLISGAKAIFRLYDGRYAYFCGTKSPSTFYRGSKAICYLGSSLEEILKYGVESNIRLQMGLVLWVQSHYFILLNIRTKIFGFLMFKRVRYFKSFFDSNSSSFLVIYYYNFL